MSDANPDKSTLEGVELALENDDDRAAAIEQAFDYRGDVTFGLTDGSTIEGYVYDRQKRGDGSWFRMMDRQGGKAKLEYAQVCRLIFSGRDPAAGRSWETWVRKYKEKKARGEKAEMKPLPLEDEPPAVGN